MAKFRTGNLVLQSNQRIEQGSSVVLNEDGAAAFATLTVENASQLDTLILGVGGPTTATIGKFS